ncbi:TetR/AcrR family transcriptional regulator [Desulfohalobiaceae bacterium Ax17]|uniref:TetR/AcrR family transcriptional regulator n=1 Tax=Desulfovulcanus ferrireducens TaxID=2831190 RepID=UPI00207BCA57|nr:TetR/AcrR family transcriptional regulator [Desulfovulcanus ferrireducens]MBT8762718.1 TetR/AcrR family transcriptional regulator [Desulfovulcanus ferrireducens]
MEEKKLTRREREKMRHRSEILEVALDLFSSKGYHNVSMHEIAKTAEFAVGTLYKFFKNKEDVYKALIFEIADQFHSAIDEVFQGTKDEYTKIMDYIRVKGKVFMSNAKAIRLYFAETSGVKFNLKATLSTELQERYETFLNQLSEVFAKGIEKGIFRAANPYYLALSLEGIVNNFLFCWLEDHEKHPFEENIAEIEKIFFQSVLTVKHEG